MSFLRHPVSAVRSQRTRTHAHLSGGFTLLEIQIAVLIFTLAMVGMVGSARVYKKLLSSTEAQFRLDGVALEAGQRTIGTVTFRGDDHPNCELVLSSIATTAGAMEADVYVTRRSP